MPTYSRNRALLRRPSDESDAFKRTERAGLPMPDFSNYGSMSFAPSIPAPSASAPAFRTAYQGATTMNTANLGRPSTEADAFSPSDNGAPLEKPNFGAEAYTASMLAQAGGMKKGPGGPAGWVFGRGKFKGLSQDQAIERIRTNYAGMGDQSRMAWESRANNRDVRTGREDAAYSAFRQDQYQRTQPGGMMPGAPASPMPATAQSNGMIANPISSPQTPAIQRIVPAQTSPFDMGMQTYGGGVVPMGTIQAGYGDPSINGKRSDLQGMAGYKPGNTRATMGAIDPRYGSRR